MRCKETLVENDDLLGQRQGDKGRGLRVFDCFRQGMYGFKAVDVEHGSMRYQMGYHNRVLIPKIDLWPCLGGVQCKSVRSLSACC